MNRGAVFYLSGPMTGIADANFPAFHAAAAQMRAAGYQVINPAELNPEQGRLPGAARRRAARHAGAPRSGPSRSHSMNRDFLPDFQRDIAQHQLRVIRDDGVNRHLRFQRPGTMCMHFDLITWPGYLCYTGDMGTYVFRRLEDMLQFFRRTESLEPYRIDMRYWAEKVEAGDRHHRGDGVQEFSAEQFKTDVRDYFEQATADEEDWPAARKAALWEEIDQQVLGALDYDEHEAWVALREFEHDGFRFEDWERSCKVFSHRFTWCCCALQWAIGVYDAAKAGQRVAA